MVIKKAYAMNRHDGTSSVETIELKRSGRKAIYSPTEKIRIVEVDNFPLLGKFTAFRFIEWVLKNPGGAIIWALGQDAADTNQPLLCTVSQELLGTGGVSSPSPKDLISH